MKIKTILYILAGLIALWVVLKFKSIVGFFTGVAGAATGEQYIAPNMTPVPVSEAYAQPTISQAALASNGSPFLEGVFRNIGTGENTNFQAASDSLKEAQNIAARGINTDNLVGWMDLSSHNLAGVKGMNL